VAGQETIEILDAATLKADGRKIPVGPDRILDIAPQVPRDVALYNEYHALIVEHCKKFCRKKPLFGQCPLKGMCRCYVKSSDSISP
jgi:endonuclease-3 related protein